MFGFRKIKHTDFKLLIEEKSDFITILNSITVVLKTSNNLAQAHVMINLIEILDNNDFPNFIKLINGVDMWGGAGAVWEVYIEGSTNSKEFELNMLKLIKLMEKTEILGNGIQPIKKLFENNLR